MILEISNESQPLLACLIPQDRHFDKDHDSAEGSCSQAYGFATITMYSWWQPSEMRTEFKNLERSPKVHCSI